MLFRSFCIFSALLLTFSQLSWSDLHHGGVHANSHAPIGVMGDHLHKKDEWMFSLRAMRMTMDGLGSDSRDVSIADYFANSTYRMAPKNMDMNMVMMGVMYAPSDNLTLMVGLPYVENTMDIQTRTGVDFSTSSYDIGDLKVSALIRSFEKDAAKSFHKLHFNVGVSIPTGDIDHKIVTPMSNGNEVILPYPMQVGTGSYISTLGFTYNAGSHGKRWGWGSQLLWMSALNQNSRDYKVGDRTKLNTWLTFALYEKLSFSWRIQYDVKKNYEGKDPMLNPIMAVTADPKLRGYDRIEIFTGLNYVFFNDHRLSLEWGNPLSESLDGPQMKLKNTLILGWQKAF